jgi:putative addiction module CopG family antidote
MATSIPPEIEHYLDEVVRSGRYASSDQAVREAFRLLRQHDRQAEALRADIKAGFDQLERGEGIELDDAGLREFLADVQSRGRHRYENAKNRP